MSYAEGLNYPPSAPPSEGSKSDIQYPHLAAMQQEHESSVNGITYSFRKSVNTQQNKLNHIEEEFIQPMLKGVQEVKDHEKKLDRAITVLEKDLDSLKGQRENLEQSVAERLTILKKDEKEAVIVHHHEKRYLKPALLVVALIAGVYLFRQGVPVNVRHLEMRGGGYNYYTR